MYVKFCKIGRAHPPKRETLNGLIDLIRWNNVYEADNLVRAMECLASHAHEAHRFDSTDEALGALLELSRE